MSKENQEPIVMLNDKEMKVSDLTPQQQYFHSQILDLSNQESRIQFQLDQVQASKSVFEKAFILTSQKGFSRDQIFFSDLIKTEIASLIHEIKLLKISLETKNKISYNDNKILGPVSVIKNLSAYLSTEMNTRFSRIKKLNNLDTFDLSVANNQNLIVPLGLALESLKRPPYEGINLLSSLNPQKSQLFPKKWRSVTQVFIVILLIFSVYVFLRNQVGQRLSDQIQDIFVNYGNQIAFIKKSKITRDEVKKYLKNKEALVTAESLIQSKVSHPSAMDHLTTLTQTLDPKPSWNLKMTYLKIKGQSVILKGNIHQDFILLFKQKLQTISREKITEKQIQPIHSNLNAKSNSPISQDKNLNSKLKLKDPLKPVQNQAIDSNQVHFYYELFLKEIH